MSRPLKHRVLVVDDEENIRVVFAQLLQREDTRSLLRKMVLTPF